MPQAKPNIVILTPTIPFPNTFGNRKRIIGICDELRKWANLYCFVFPIEYRQIEEAGPDGILESSKFFDHFDIIWPTKLRPQSIPKSNIHLLDEWYDNKIHEEFNRLHSVVGVDALIVNYVFLSKIFDYIDPKISRIIDMHDIFADRNLVLEKAGIAPEFFYTNKDEEMRGLKRADIVWSITKEDKLKYEEKLNNISVLPTIISEKKPIKKNKEKDKCIGVLVGALNNLNKIYFQKFIDCFTEFNKNYASPIHIKIYGNVCSELKNTSPSISLNGYIEDVSMVYNEASFAIVPLENGTGLKTKTVEALSFNIPLFCTQHSSVGINSDFQNHLFKDVEELVEFIIVDSFKPNWLNNYKTQGQKITSKLNNQALETLNKFSAELTVYKKLFEENILTIHKNNINQKKAVSNNPTAFIYDEELLVLVGNKEYKLNLKEYLTHKVLLKNTVVIGIDNLLFLSKYLDEYDLSNEEIYLIIEKDINITPFLMHLPLNNIKIRQFEKRDSFKDMSFKLGSKIRILTKEPYELGSNSKFIQALHYTVLNSSQKVREFLIL